MKSFLESPKLLLLVFVMAGFTLIVGAFGIFYYQFHLNGLSDIPADWGVFGDYIGGLLNPLLSFLTLIGLAISIFMSKVALDASERAFRTQIDMSLASVHKAELFDLLKDVSLAIEEFLDREAWASDRNYKIRGLLHGNSMPLAYFSAGTGVNLPIYARDELCLHLIELHSLLAMYEKVDDNSPTVHHFVRKYRQVVNVFAAEVVLQYYGERAVAMRKVTEYWAKFDM